MDRKWMNRETVDLGEHSYRPELGPLDMTDPRAFRNLFQSHRSRKRFPSDLRA